MGYEFTRPFVVSSGEEEFFLDRDLRDFRDQEDYRVTLLDGQKVSEAEVVTTCETIFFAYEEDPPRVWPRAVVVGNGEGLKAGKLLKSYAERVAADDLSTVLAIVIRAKSASAFWTKLGPKATLIDHPKLKTLDYNNEVAKWVKAEADRIGLNLSEPLAKAMYGVAGDDLYRLSNELGKLRRYVGPKKAVTGEHLRTVMSESTAVTAKDLAEAALLKNQRKAMNLLSVLYQFSDDEASTSLSINGYLMWATEKLFVVRTLLDQRVSPDDVAARIDMHPYRFQKTLLPQAERQTAKGLLRTMQTLSRLDVELKRTSHRRTMVELAVLDLAS